MIRGILHFLWRMILISTIILLFIRFALPYLNLCSQFGRGPNTYTECLRLEFEGDDIWSFIPVGIKERRDRY